LIHYVVEQEFVTLGIKISKGVESVLVIRQEIVVLPRVEPTIAEGVPMALRVKCNEPIVN
jgi:hypothetical protein